MSTTGQPQPPATPLSCREAELSLGVLVLGALDPAERSQVEAHVAGCARCRDTLAGLAPLPGLLNRLDATQAEAGLPRPPERLLDDALQAAASATSAPRSVSRRVWLTAAVAAAAAVLASTAVLATRGRDSGAPPVATPTSTTTGPRVDTVLWDGASTDGAIQASVVLTAQLTGSRLLMTLTGVRSGQRCDLVIWSDDGRREVTASWQATYEGAATVTGSTTVTPQRIRRMIVATPEGDTLLRLWPAP
jgi:Putative zinc-finger